MQQKAATNRAIEGVPHGALVVLNEHLNGSLAQHKLTAKQPFQTQLKRYPQEQ
jgi:hypothetical protein